MKSSFIIVSILLITSISGAVVIQKNIATARLDQIVIKRDINDPSKIGEVIFHGQFIDDTGKNIESNLQPYTKIKWVDLPIEWKNALLPVLKSMSKQFNKIHADEDVETFDVTEITTTSTTTTTVP